MPVETAKVLANIAGIVSIAVTILGALAAIVAYFASNVKEAAADQAIAEAKRATETERLARVKLEGRIAPRRLSADARQEFDAALAPFPGRKIQIVSYALDVEGEVLASQVRDAVGKSLDVEDWIGTERPDAGFVKGASVTGADRPLVNAITSALKRAGLADVSNNLPPPSRVGFIVMEDSKIREPGAPAVLLIGAKPLPR